VKIGQLQNGVAIELHRKFGNTDLDVLQRRNPHRLMDANRGHDGRQRSQWVANAVGRAHDATVDQHSEQQSDIEQQL
jgi:hypothetical protein